MDATRRLTGSGSDLVIAMLEIALDKARQGQIRSALLVTLKPNGGADISGELTRVEDVEPAIKKLGEARRMLRDMQARTGASGRAAG